MQSMKYCNNCGKEIPQDAAYCPECGCSATNSAWGSNMVELELEPRSESTKKGERLVGTRHGSGILRRDWTHDRRLSERFLEGDKLPRKFWNLWTSSSTVIQSRTGPDLLVQFVRDLGNHRGCPKIRLHRLSFKGRTRWSLGRFSRFTPRVFSHGFTGDFSTDGVSWECGS